MPHWPIPHGFKDIKLGLERVLSMLELVGNPHLKLPPVIHFAGTNGKGSTLAFTKSILQQAGFKVSSYTSPHIRRFNERINLNGIEIDDASLYNLAEEVRIAVKDIQGTFFEATTVMAFLAMSRANSDIILLETGLGGRLDATNVVPEPLCSVITPIDFDHMEYLGNTLAAIAGEKAGIIKSNSHAIISWQYQESIKVLMDKIKSVGAKSYICGRDWNFEIADRTSENQSSVDFDSKAFAFIDRSGESLSLPQPALVGAHQYINAATAVATIMRVKQEPRFSSIDYNHIKQGLKKASWPARLEKITRGKLYESLPYSWELWVDGAHNVAGARMLALYLQQTRGEGPVIIINGRSADRDIKGFLECFKGLTEEVVAVKIHCEPASEDPNKIYTIAQELGFTSYCEESLAEALNHIRKRHAESPHNKNLRILVCGSLYLAADLLSHNG